MLNAKGVLAIVGGFGADIWFTASALRRSAALQRAAWWPSAPGRILDRADRSGANAMWVIAIGGTVPASLLAWLAWYEDFPGR
jgi:hypothetical protein